MFSVVASDVLAIVDASTLKHPPSSFPISYTPAEEHHTGAWASDNSALYLSSAQTISRFDPSTTQLKILHTPNDGSLIRCIAAKDKCTVIYGSGAGIHVLDCGGQTPKVTQSFGPHKHDVLSLSLSNDSTLLACGLSNAAYVHNLTTGSQTTLRGLPSKPCIAMCVFHPHVRTRLLVGYWDQLFVYDTTRPSSPLKIISVGDAGTCISAIACSPFSKTLVAVAMSNGGVGLVDMDKEKGLFRTLNLNVPLTTIAFSAEGASIYLGTENGKLLVQDLRVLDKPPKSVIVSESGNAINAIAVQKKLKDPPVAAQAKGTPKSVTKSTVNTPISKAAASPLRSRATRPSGPSASTPARNALTGTPKQTPSSKANGPKVLSPARDPLRNSPRLESKEAPKVKKAHPLSNASISTKPRSSSAKTTVPSGVTCRTTSSSSNRTRRISMIADASLATQQENTMTEDVSSISHARTRSQTRKTSSTSVNPKISASTAQRSTRTVSATSISSATSRRKPSSSTPRVPPVPSISTDFIANIRPVSSISKRDDDNRTPSPDLPDMKTDLATPIPAQKKKDVRAMAVLGLGTPEVSAWLKAGMSNQVSQTSLGGKGKGRVKSVGFKDGAVDDKKLDYQVKETNDLVDLDGDREEERERERSLSLQISPRRPLPLSSSSPNHGHSHSWDASPMRTSSRHAANLGGSVSAGSAHELLRTIVKDVMYDFQKETRAEIMGLHLDLVRMGRSWKQELRTLMEEYVGDLNDLREENRRLREENERLRGF